ncbi:MAG: hypothetical protein ACRDHF_12200 [Tepidiformaceae bacterium]
MSARVFHHDGYQELYLSGRLMGDLLSVPLDDLAGATRVLVDYSDVTDIDLPVGAFVELARENDEKGLRIAVYAPTPLTFGWNRQVLQLAEAREGFSVSVFKDLDLAVAWLMADGAGAKGFGGSWRSEPPSVSRTA